MTLFLPQSLKSNMHHILIPDEIKTKLESRQLDPITSYTQPSHFR